MLKKLNLKIKRI